MIKTIPALLVLALATPSTVMAQAPNVRADHLARTWIAHTSPSSIRQLRFAGRNPLRAVTTRPTIAAADAQQPAARTWVRRHPVVLGALIGTGAGALLGASGCWRQVCGDGHGPLLVAFGAGLGAGIGSGVGLTISIATR
jgi:hypothetical protein